MVDAAGYDVVLVETFGAGQNEIEIQALAETVVLALMPGSGDGIQAIKAGLMEIPDVLVINKADRPGTSLLRAELEATLSLVPSGPWRPPIVETVALEGGGVAELWAEVERHQTFLSEDGRFEARRREGIERQLRSLALERLKRQLATAPPDAVRDLVDAVAARFLDPGAAVDQLLNPPE